MSIVNLAKCVACIVLEELSDSTLSEWSQWRLLTWRLSFQGCTHDRQRSYLKKSEEFGLRIWHRGFKRVRTIGPALFLIEGQPLRNIPTNDRLRRNWPTTTGFDLGSFFWTQSTSKNAFVLIYTRSSHGNASGRDLMYTRFSSRFHVCHKCRADWQESLVFPHWKVMAENSSQVP